MDPVFVFAVLGESPAVLTELLWWLGVQERLLIAGIEVWGTARGVERLRDLVEGPAWEALGHAIGPQLPVLREPGTPDPVPLGLAAFRFVGTDGPLDDVRSAEEAATVSAALHDRIRALVRRLPEHVQVVGSLAGGRKTVSAALQTAFVMQARQGDRLVHVVPSVALETRLRERGRFREFAFPTEAWEDVTGVPIDDQITVYDQPFPRLRLLGTAEIARALDKAWSEVWPALEGGEWRRAEGYLQRIATGWVLVLLSPCGATLARVELTPREGAILAAMATLEGEPSTDEVVEWLDTYDVGWSPRARRIGEEEGDAVQLRSNAVSKGRDALRKRLDRALSLDLVSRFGLPSAGFVYPSIPVLPEREEGDLTGSNGRPPSGAGLGRVPGTATGPRCE